MLTNADIDRLTVAHWSKEASVELSDVANANFATEGLVIDTCLRRAVVWLEGDPVPGNARLTQSAPRIFAGRAAYQLLLEIATGLQSSVPGETNVFGQCQNAWRSFQTAGKPELVEGLRPIVTQLFVDTKEIRSRWLEGAGGTSYGSIVRRMIRAKRNERVLFAGTGDLMRSMLPMFRRYPIGVWNHRASLVTSNFAGIIFAPEAGSVAASWSNHIVLTTPADTANDHKWQRWINTARPKTVTHLGQRHGQRFTTDFECRLFNLDDVFSFRDIRQAMRTARIQGALKECFDRSHGRQDEQIDTAVFTHSRQRVAA